MAVAAGKLEPVTVHHVTGSTKNVRGDAVETFTDRKAYAEIRALPAEERYNDQEFVDRSPHVLTMRHLSLIHI